jgi:crotonobetainyl-CoA:carnitine CoA-transferase CaiB-like acyl-CoA transferase
MTESSQTLPSSKADGPLHGVRGVVLTQVWAGTFAMQLLALLGAEIIHVESRQRVDPFRGGSWEASIPTQLRERPSAQHPWNLGMFNSVNLNKKSVTLDLNRPEGKNLFLDLLKSADFFVENFSPRVMKNFHLEYEDLIAVKPDLIVVNQGAFGHRGVYWNAPGTGGQVEPMAGGTELLGYEDDDPIGSGTLWCDPVSGYHTAAAVLTALYYRDRSGKGQQVDVSMQECNALFHADALMQFSLGGGVRRRTGNHHIQFAPHNIYACADGKWLALAVRSEDEWANFCRLSGHEAWLADSRFASMAERKRNESELDQLISGWCRDQDADRLEQLLSPVLPAAKVRGPTDMRLDLGYLRERGFVATVEHREAGPIDQLITPYHLSRSNVQVRPAPTHGEHSWEVLSSLLGLSREEYEKLVADGITGEGPPPEWAPGSNIGRSVPPGVR